MLIFKKFRQTISLFAGISMLAMGSFSSTMVNAQSSYSAPTGTFTCLINANYSGYTNKTSKGSDPQAVNAFLVITFSSTAPYTGQLVASVTNNVADFEKANPITTTTTSLPSPVAFKLTQITAAKNIYLMKSDTDGDTPTYIAVVNSGNSILFMSSPPDNRVHNGVCQKV
ncbi:hypothetical protein [Limnohabitans sp.]|uniref:hypothetical protein n=1 Tax=Limnohabitans sp. TaxID=1907725 RepID=UPI002AFE548B|nr:hypothetical protein [Limnohabitans sp.]